MPECSVITKSWSELSLAELYALLKLRTDVFFLEQRIAEEELDNRDQECTTQHYWLQDLSGVAAYLRVLEDAAPTYGDAHRIVGRVVVRADRRGEGLAQLLFARVLEEFGGEALMLHAQEYIAPLYAKFGFHAYGEVYVEAGIRHISMYRAGAE